MFTHAEYVAGRGTVVAMFGKVVVFSRKDSNGARVFDVVDYNCSPNGSHVTTRYDAKDAKTYAKSVAESYI